MGPPFFRILYIMMYNTFLIVVFILNLLLGINHITSGNTTKSGAFCWFVSGWLTLHVLLVLGILG